MIRLAAAASLAVLAASGAAAQPAPPAPAEQIVATDDGRVVVRGRRMNEVQGDLEDYVSDFIGEVAAPAPGRGFARWQQRVCVGVMNIEAEPAQYIADRVSLLALELGLDPGDPGCSPDVLVMFTLDAKVTAAELVENELQIFRPGGNEGGMQLGRHALDDFVNSDRPVRWWHVSLPTDPRTGQSAIRLPNMDGPPTVTDGGGGGSRIYQQLRDDMTYALILVDATKLEGVTWEELGDYIALVALAQIDPQSDPSGFDSILNLFTNPEAYSGLTDWDRSYVSALYSYDQYRRPEVQAVELINQMARQEEGAN